MNNVAATSHRGWTTVLLPSCYTYTMGVIFFLKCRDSPVSAVLWSPGNQTILKTALITLWLEMENLNHLPFGMILWLNIGILHPQIRQQMSGPKISQYEKPILGCGPLVWAGLWNKRVWADYEQLLRPVFSLFWGQKIISNFFLKTP